MMLEIKELRFAPGGVSILDGVSAEIRKGEFVGLVGPNGCGKSSLLKHIYRAYSPKEGAVFISGEDVRKMSSRYFARQASVVAQEHTVEFDMSVGDMVMFGRYAHGSLWKRDARKDGAVCRKCLERVGLAGCEGRSFASLSGGEKQRVILARALAQECRLIILDEPTNHLDIKYQYRLMEILRREQATVFSSVHDLNIAAMYCQRILLMKEGRIFAQGSPEEVMTPENIREVFGVNAQIQTNPVTKKLQIYYIPDEKQI